MWPFNAKNGQTLFLCSELSGGWHWLISAVVVTGWNPPSAAQVFCSASMKVSSHAITDWLADWLLSGHVKTVKICQWRHANDFKLLAARHSSTAFRKLFTTHAVGSVITGKSAVRLCGQQCLTRRSKINLPRLQVRIMPGVRADLELSKKGEDVLVLLWEHDLQQSKCLCRRPCSHKRIKEKTTLETLELRTCYANFNTWWTKQLEGLPR